LLPPPPPLSLHDALPISIRVELDPLTREDFVRILTEPQNALITQYTELLRTEQVTLRFTPDAVEAIAEIAMRVNASTENIGARRDRKSTRLNSSHEWISY